MAVAFIIKLQPDHILMTQQKQEACRRSQGYSAAYNGGYAPALTRLT